MENRTQPSFIPRQPVIISGSVLHPRKHLSIFSLIANIIFLIVIAAAGLVFGANWYLDTSNKKIEADLQAIIQTFDNELTENLEDLNARMIASGILLDRHVAMSLFFENLEDTTLETVQFNNFSFKSDGKALKVDLKGIARGYGSLARQSEILGLSKAVSSFKFSDLTLDERGLVGFSLTAGILPGEVSYQQEVLKNLAPLEPEEVSTTTPTI